MSDKLPTSAERIKALDRVVWIGYSRVKEIRDAMDSLLEYPRMHRMPNLAIIGATNNGKSMLLENFVKKHKTEDSPENVKTTLPVIRVQMAPEPDEGRLYDILLTRLFSNQSAREPVTSKLFRLQTLLTKLETKQIILDEFNYAAVGTLSKQRKFLNALKYLSNELRISLVVAGTPETLSALQADEQMANRFSPMYLPKWKEDAELLKLLVTLEKKIDLKNESRLWDGKLPKFILSESEGTIGEINDLIVKLAKYAILTGGGAYY